MRDECPTEQQTAKIRAEVREKYRSVAQQPGPAAAFPYPVGQDSAQKLGYKPSWLQSVPAASTERFIGSS